MAWVDLAYRAGVAGREDCQAGWQQWAGRFFRYQTILDVGAGLGHSRSRLALGGNVVSLQDPGPGLAVDCSGDVSSLPDGAYDVVTAFDVIEHVEADADFLGHLCRIARRYVLLTTPNWEHSRCRNPCHIREYSPAQFQRLLAGREVLLWLSGDPDGRQMCPRPEAAFPDHGEPHQAAVIRVAPPTLTVLLPTVGRACLKRALDSIRTQRLLDGDEVLLVGDGEQPAAREAWARAELPGRYVEVPGPNGDWGHTPRNRVMAAAAADYLIHLDDDDAFLPGALERARSALANAPGHVHLFRMVNRATGGVLWADRAVREGNVGTPMMAHPRRAPRGHWTPRYGGDYDFIRMTVELNEGCVWREEELVEVIGTGQAADS